MLLEELQGNGLCQSPTSVFFLSFSSAFAIADGTAIHTSQCKLANEPSGPDANSVSDARRKEVLLLRRILIQRNPQAIGELLLMVNIAALGNRTNVLLSHSQHF
jgi:hypothetical protein